jgi:hypothetical protein
MRNLIFLFVLMLSIALVAADFSGTWVLNRDKSELGDGPGSRMAAKKMVVEQKENSLKIESTREGRDGSDRTMTREMTLDGKETKDSSRWGESVTTASLKDDVLTINTTRTFERDGQTNSMDAEQKWALQDDGKTLTIDLKSDSPWGESTMKMVYDKQ